MPHDGRLPRAGLPPQQASKQVAPVGMRPAATPVRGNTLPLRIAVTYCCCRIATRASCASRNASSCHTRQGQHPATAHCCNLLLLPHCHPSKLRQSECTQLPHPSETQPCNCALLQQLLLPHCPPKQAVPVTIHYAPSCHTFQRHSPAAVRCCNNCCFRIATRSKQCLSLVKNAPSCHTRQGENPANVHSVRL
jgi:hypothetical protein